MLFGEQMLLLAAQNENSLSQPRLASSDSPIPRFPNSPILRFSGCCSKNRTKKPKISRKKQSTCSSLSSSTRYSYACEDVKVHCEKRAAAFQFNYEMLKNIYMLQHSFHRNNTVKKFRNLSFCNIQPNWLICLIIHCSVLDSIYIYPQFLSVQMGMYFKCGNGKRECVIWSRRCGGRRVVDCTGLCQIQVLVLAQKMCAQNYQQQVFALVWVFASVWLRWWGQPRIHIATYISTSTAAAAEIGAKFTDASKNTKKKEKKQNEWKMESNCSGTGPHLYECAFVRHFKDEENRMPQTS